MKMATGFRREQTHRGNSRRGVTLLMVVSIIVLFLLMGAAFLVVATQFRRSATVLSHVRERRDDAPTLVKRAFQDLLREPSLENVRSPLRGHSLLGDLYGYGFTRTGVPVAALVNQGQGIWSITLQAPYDQLRSDLDGGLTTPFPDNGSFNGRYLSLTDLYDANGVRLGKHLGLTGFILDYQVLPPSPPGGNRYRFFVRFGWDDAQFLPAATFTTFQPSHRSRDQLSPPGPQRRGLQTESRHARSGGQPDYRGNSNPTLEKLPWDRQWRERGAKHSLDERRL
jgi:hypothetical protein